jgi:hypothetical protein
MDRNGTTGPVLGGSSNDFIAQKADGNMWFRIGGGTLHTVTMGALDDNMPFSLSRVGNTVSYDFGGVTGNVTDSGTFTFMFIGRYSPSTYYTGRLSGILSMIGDGASTRTYDFNLSSHDPGPVVVTDTTSGLDATSATMDETNWEEL